MVEKKKKETQRKVLLLCKVKKLVTVAASGKGNTFCLQKLFKNHKQPGVVHACKLRQEDHTVE